MDTFHVHGLRVSKAFQRRGLATQLMLFVESHALERGASELTLGVDEFNSPARQLYQKLDYTVFKIAEGRTASEALLLMKKSLKKSLRKSLKKA